MLLALIVTLGALCPTAGQSLTDIKKAFRAGDTSARRGALQDAAELYAAETPEGVAVTKFVADALRDDDVRVRVGAAYELSHGLDLATAMPRLVAAARDYSKDVKSRRREVDRGLKRSTRTGKTRDFSGALDSAKQVDAMYPFEIELTKAFGRLKHDDSVRGLEILLEVHPVGHRRSAALKALIKLGTADALGAAIGMLPDYRDAIGAAEKKLRSTSRQRREKLPRWYKGGKDAWNIRETQRIESDVKRAQGSIDNLKNWGISSFQEPFAAFAEEHALEPPPDNLERAAEWSSWLRRSSASLPANFAVESDR